MQKLFVGECIGTFILVLFGCGAVGGAVLFGAFSSLLEIALIWGIGVSLGIFASRNLSLAHLNPAVSAAMWLAGYIQLKELPAYVLGQMTGAFAAALLLYAMLSPSIEVFEMANGLIRGQAGSHLSAVMFGEYYPNPGFADKIQISLWAAALLEAFGTFILVFMIFALTQLEEQIDNTTPLFIGLTVTIIITLIAPFTQAGLNPARDFAPRMVAWMMGWGSAAFPDAAGGWCWVYIIGPLTGGVMAYGVFARISRLKKGRIGQDEIL